MWFERILGAVWFYVGWSAAITRDHLTEPQVLQGGKVSVFERGMVALSFLSLQ